MGKRGRPARDIEMIIEVKRLKEEDGLRVKEIVRALDLDERFASLDHSERTVQRCLEDPKPIDTSGDWSPFDPDPDPAVAPLVLPTLAVIMERSVGRKASFSNKQVGHLARVLRMAPELAALPQHAWSIAQCQIIVEAGARQEDADSLFALMAFAPWRSDQAYFRWWKWVAVCRPAWKSDLPGVPSRLGRGRAIGVTIALEIEADVKRMKREIDERIAEGLEKEAKRCQDAQGKKAACSSEGATADGSPCSTSAGRAASGTGRRSTPGRKKRSSRRGTP